MAQLLQPHLQTLAYSSANVCHEKNVYPLTPVWFLSKGQRNACSAPEKSKLDTHLPDLQGHKLFRKVPVSAPASRQFVQALAS